MSAKNPHPKGFIRSYLNLDFLGSGAKGFSGKRYKIVELTSGPLHILCTVEPQFNKPLYNEVLGITNDIRQPGQSYSKEPRYNEPRYDEILVITSTTQKPKRKMYLDITNKCQHVTEKMNAKWTNKNETS